jgi:Asp-tRNA(Asn)/Glu-tRNA(Gln) amidotransferase A subunit family amidase
MEDTADMPTQNGSAIYKDSQPGVDSAVVGTCRAAGAIILGKTVCLYRD